MNTLWYNIGLNDTEEHGVKNALNENQEKRTTTSDEQQQVTDGTAPPLASATTSFSSNDQSERNNTTQHSNNNNAQQLLTPSESNLVDTTTSSFLARDAILSTLEIPPIPEGLGRGRMTIRNFVASIDILGPTAARTKMVVNVDPNLQLM